MQITHIIIREQPRNYPIITGDYSNITFQNTMETVENNHFFLLYPAIFGNL